jgi:hypothetical protein
MIRCRLTIDRFRDKIWQIGTNPRSLRNCGKQAVNIGSEVTQKKKNIHFMLEIT